ncbi:T9SS type A sorting domain-containing protein [Owenweeksia hongkongensis]|uniref:T9SS type A sorting domain-containing protein n=1 Tax=Owenweeksia hongkongensis TaxID=253245 RepID=UPI003A955CE7
MKKFLLLTLAISCQFLFAQNIIYVNHAATGADDGSSWPNAYADLQDALETAQAGDDIWVAQGTYYPSKDINYDANVDTKQMSFAMIDSVGIYGGFAGTETIRQQRDWRSNQTILSGDLGVIGDKTDNSRHVIYNDWYLSDQSVLDGFVVRDGYAMTVVASTDDKLGGGILNTDYSISAIFRNLKITRCSAYNGGGAIFTVEDNRSIFFNCQIINNYGAFVGGAGIVCVGDDTFINCVVGSNTVNTSSPVSGADLADVLVNYGTVRFIGCTFANCSGSRAITSANKASVFLVNSIISDSILIKEEAFPSNISSVNVSNSLVRYSGGSSNWAHDATDLGGNIDTNAYFVGAGSFELQSISPAINAGLNDSIPMDIHDLDDDGITNELLPLDLNGTMRVADGRVDLGAYEYIPAWADTTYQTICNGDSIAFDSSYYAEGGVYKQSYTPDSAQYFSLNIDTPNTDVQAWFGGILEAKADSVSYRWIDCNDSTINFGITDKIFYPAKPGNYAVIITTPNGCVDTSACFQVSNISLSENPLSNTISLYPNPSKDVLHVVLPKKMVSKNTGLNVLDVNGKIILQKQLDTSRDKEITLDVKHFPRGIYFLKIEDRVLRFVKQ